MIPTIVCCIAEAQAKIYRVTNNSLPPTDYIGTITIKQLANGNFKFSGKLENLPSGSHGFHIHKNYSIDNGCMGAGPHLNLHNTTHGGLKSTIRHEGDLGNIHTHSLGGTIIDIEVGGLDFEGYTNLIKRVLVIHENIDDLGLGKHQDSLSTGNSGARIACGLIVPLKI